MVLFFNLYNALLIFWNRARAGTGSKTLTDYDIYIEFNYPVVSIVFIFTVTFYFWQMVLLFFWVFCCHVKFIVI